MRNLVKWNEHWFYELSNNSINVLRKVEWYNENHLAQILVDHCETYKSIIENLLESNNNLKYLLDYDIEKRR